MSSHYYSVLTGGVVIFALGLIENIFHSVDYPFWVWAVALLTSLSISQFLAWKELRLRHLRMTNSYKLATDQRESLRRALAGMEHRLAAKEAELSGQAAHLSELEREIADLRERLPSTKFTILESPTSIDEAISLARSLDRIRLTPDTLAPGSAGGHYYQTPDYSPRQIQVRLRDLLRLACRRVATVVVRAAILFSETVKRHKLAAIWGVVACVWILALILTVGPPV